MYRKSQKIIEKLYLKENLESRDIEKLCKLACSTNVETRRDVAVLLGRTRGHKSEDVLYHLTFDKSNIVRIEAVDSLANGNSQRSLQRLNQIICSRDPYLRLYGIQSLTDVYFNQKGTGGLQKKVLLKQLQCFEVEECDELVLAAIQKCKVICGDMDAVSVLINTHQSAKAGDNYHLISPVENMLEELSGYI